MCGHSYCVACLHHLLVSALDGGQFPLVCLGNDSHCKTPIPIPVIKRFLTPTLFNRLLEVAFKYHVSTHPEVFRFCKTPDCTQIYRSTSSRAAVNLRCPSCFSGVCSSCDMPHEGQTCVEYERTKSAERGRQEDAWIAAQGGRMKKCPKCTTLIEKTGGCNRVTCKLVSNSLLPPNVGRLTQSF
ncbi:hypothetical protein ID866_6840 [Astraeus odoratus]|nr:hypothetical protein ID866_6840 [Astraeus odoratus]